MVHDHEIADLASIASLREQVEDLAAQVANLEAGLRKLMEVCKDLHKLSQLNREAIVGVLKHSELVLEEVHRD